MRNETHAWFSRLRSHAEMEVYPSPRLPDWPILGRHFGLAAAIGLLAFWLDRGDLLGYIDGQYLLTLIRQQAEFAASGPVFSTNPLQGLGDVWYTTNTLWIPELRFGGLFTGPAAQRIAIHWFAFIEIFLATTLLARWLGQSAAKSVAAGWLAVILITPLTYPSLIYNVSPDAPNIATTITFPFIVIVLWEGIGTGRHWHDPLRATAIVVAAWWSLIAVSIVTTISYPLIACVCLVQLGFAWRRRAEFWRKVAWGAAIIALLLASGFAQVLFGLIGDTAFRLFPKELPTRAVPQIIEGSIMFRPEKFGQLVAVAGLCGALFHAVFDHGRMRAFAGGAALVIAVIAILGIAQVYFSLPGAPPIYYEFAVWAVYPIFAISVVAWIWRFVRWATNLTRFHAGARVGIGLGFSYRSWRRLFSTTAISATTGTIPCRTSIRQKRPRSSNSFALKSGCPPTGPIAAAWSP